ncbi:hypothetical protein [Pseudomonas orientalis]|uniref:hypothetical protein n=1 Tax=Pseudomonas orientalis TaxID=76758 RepID=UPI000F564479|nr:hypothetical protein [Pseudomonas orientalis]
MPFRGLTGDITYLHLCTVRALAGKKSFHKLPSNDIEKGHIVVINSKTCTAALRDEFEECGHSFALLVYLLGGDLQLPQRARLALLEYGVAQLDRFERAEARLRDYVEDATPS